MTGTVLHLQLEGILGGLIAEPGSEALLPNAEGYSAHAVGDGLLWRFPAGALEGLHYLSADLLLGGEHLAMFSLELHEGEGGPAFELSFGLLNLCETRLRLPLGAVDQNRWKYPREGGWLKPICRGARVSLARVDRVSLTVLRKSDRPVRWSMTPLVATASEPPKLSTLRLPKGPLLDRLGQSTLHDWPAKSRSSEEVTARLHAQLEAAREARWPDGFSRWGGWLGRRFTASGFFRTQDDGRRWWLVDPDGCAFWSSGPNCVQSNIDAAYEGLEAALAWLPEDGPLAAARGVGEHGRPSLNFLGVNLRRAFGDLWHERWAELALGSLKGLGFNTVANWSEWRVARAAGFPYVRPLHPALEGTPHVFRDFPDVFHPAFTQDAHTFAETLRETADDPALIGYFLMNEPSWGFAEAVPAEGMLYNTPSCASRRALAAHLRERYGDDAGLSAAWGMKASLEDVAEGPWTASLTDLARRDLERFSTVMVEGLFGGLSAACREIDPHHLNLGVRYYTVPPRWAVEGMRAFDVFSVNQYRERLDATGLAPISALLERPILAGEWHFGALDVGLPASGIGHVRDQEARGQAYRVYLEDAAAQPWCVGAHYFTLYDQSALGRFDGENYNIGFFDVCHRPYAPLAAAAQASHARLYEVAAGELAPFDDPPDYLPKLF